METVTLKSVINITELFKLVNNKSFEEITKSIDTQNIEIKSNDNLYLLSYKKNETNDTGNLTELQREANGIIFEKNTNSVVCMSYPVFSEITYNELLLNPSGVYNSLPYNTHMEYCEDGTVIRLYNYNNNWMTSTTRCIDAKNSFWSSSKSFDDLFWEVFDKNLLDTLDKNSTYIFVLLHKENRIVVNQRENKLVYISQIVNTPFILHENVIVSENFSNIFKDTPNIKRPKVIGQLNINNFSDYVINHKRGILFKTYNQSIHTWTTWRLDFDEYSKYKEIRGNVPNIYLRYLELLNDKEKSSMLYNMYPEHKKKFSEIGKKFSALCKEIYELYVESHIKHNMKIEDQNPYFLVLKALHAQYKNKNESIKYNDVKNKLIESNRRILLGLIS
jgi:hypothetical protein